MRLRATLVVSLFCLACLSVVAQTGPIDANENWEPQFLTDDAGVEVVLVPSGCFEMGIASSDPDETPGSEQTCIGIPIVLDRFEVTNALYGSTGFFAGDDRPRDSVSWEDASTFCATRTYNGEPMRLPTEAEWEFAARGPNGLIYPWGNIPNLENAANSANSENETVPVGSFPSGDSWVGASDMSGNVWEWTSSAYMPYPYDVEDGREDPTMDMLRVLRGGAATNMIDLIYTTNRFARPADSGYALVGFRCAAPFDTPQPVVQIGDIWEVQIETFDGVEMALVPAGSFFMGSEDGDSDESPVTEITIENAFWMDRYEVTNAQFGSTGRFTGDNQPRDSVSWNDALAHCEARGGRLPTEAEWEWAARGPVNNVYPWGNDFVREIFVWQGTSGGQTSDVGTVPESASWAGVENMAGNVSEWTSSIYQAYPYDPTDGRESIDGNARRTVRGGAYNIALPPRAADRDGRFEPIDARDSIGFRCVLPFN